jgi:hypothetical protein
MLGVVKVFGGMLVLGRIATRRVSADHAHAQMDPGIAGLNAVFTHMLVRLPDFDLIEVRTFFCHLISPCTEVNHKRSWLPRSFVENRAVTIGRGTYSAIKRFSAKGHSSSIHWAWQRKPAFFAI